MEQRQHWQQQLQWEWGSSTKHQSTARKAAGVGGRAETTNLRIGRIDGNSIGAAGSRQKAEEVEAEVGVDSNKKK